ncbi:hypothetical protein HDG38_001317 [Paraburkholderia sp. WSM4177]|nr:hypothetical protein [Paraburkholderia sp. WSM4177]MBB5482472.1 hypothetical protein [Paraburkholderia sp. WSM4180]
MYFRNAPTCSLFIAPRFQFYPGDNHCDAGGKGDVPRAEAVRKNQERDGGKVANKPGTMVMRDAFSFEITPDTENL